MRKGRKKLPQDKKKKHQVKATFTSDDYTEVLSRANKAHLPISVYVAQSAMNADVISLLTSEEVALLRSLFKIGVNLNQIAKHLNGDPTWPCQRLIQDEVRELSALRRKLLEEINKKQ